MLPLKLDQYKIVLASKSPRRQELLTNLELSFDVIVPNVEEIVPAGMDITNIPTYLAGLKSEPFFNSPYENLLVITSDTVVIVEDNVLGKPNNKSEAFNMLRQLSGKKHQVISGVCIATLKKRKLFSVTTDVYFNILSDEEIEYYIDHYQPFDKAGSYGIQEWIGFIGIEKIEGSYFNVVGLPLQRLYQELKKFE